VTVVRKSNGQFVAGWSGGPGRPRGARSKLSELALQALRDDFAEFGPAVIKQVRETRPHHYLSLVVSLLPRELKIERGSELAQFTDQEIETLERLLRSEQAKTIDAVAGNGPAIEPEKP
jgi:hypothetical protein